MMRKAGCLIARATPGVNWVMKPERLLEILSLNSSDTVSDGVTARRPCVGGAYSRSRPNAAATARRGLEAQAMCLNGAPSVWGAVPLSEGPAAEGFRVTATEPPPGTPCRQ